MSNGGKYATKYRKFVTCSSKDILCKLGKDLPVKNLAPIQENLLKLAKHNEKDLFEIEKVIRRNKGKELVK